MALPDGLKPMAATDPRPLARSADPGQAPVSRAPRRLRAWLAAATALVCMLVIWGDRTWPEAGLWALLGLSLSTGLVHGALDAQLLLQRFATRQQASAMAGLYLLGVVMTAAALAAAPSLALLLLVLMSIWHFGEPYQRWPTASVAQAMLTRLVVGGAPVALLQWQVWDASTLSSLHWLAGAATQALQAIAATWLGLTVVWAARCGLPRWRAHRHALAELAAVVLLNMTLSPLMAFAVYFGVYHAPVHVWRVLGIAQASAENKLSRWLATSAVILLTAALGLVLWTTPVVQDIARLGSADVMRWLIVGLAALTWPHLILITACSRLLSAPRSGSHARNGDRR
jgi:Brp/Blh family beta-carotene 15,15'-monooxygenase